MRNAENNLINFIAQKGALIFAERQTSLQQLAHVGVPFCVVKLNEEIMIILENIRIAVEQNPKTGKLTIMRS